MGNASFEFHIGRFKIEPLFFNITWTWCHGYMLVQGVLSVATAYPHPPTVVVLFFLYF